MPNPSCANQSTVNVCVLASETERRAYFIARPHHCIRQGSHFPYITLILKKKKLCWQVDAPTFSHTVELTFWFSELC